MLAVLQKITQSMTTTGTRSATADPLLDQYVWLSPGKLFEHQPTVRLDYNLTSRHRLSGSFSVIAAERDPDYLNGYDVRFPGASNFAKFSSTRPLVSVTLRSTLGGTIVNELRGGMTASTAPRASGRRRPTARSRYADQDGYAIDFDANIGLDQLVGAQRPTWRSAPTYSIEDTVTWQRGSHSISFGGIYLLSKAEEFGQQMVPGANLGMSTIFDPAIGLFTTTYFPGASSGQLADARDRVRAAHGARDQPHRAGSARCRDRTSTWRSGRASGRARSACSGGSCRTRGRSRRR